MNPKKLKQVTGLLEQRAYDKVIPLLTSELQRHPKDGEGHYLLATACAAVGQLAAAQHHHSQSCRFLGRGPRTLYPLAWVTMRLGRTDDAAPLFREVLESNPKHAGANYFLASICLLQGEFDQAQELFAAAAVDPLMQMAALTGQASILERKGEYDEAMGLLWPHFVKGSRDIGMMGILAEIFCHSDIKPTRALLLTEALESLLQKGVPGWEKMTPVNRASPFFDLGGLYEKQGKYEEALTAFSRANAFLPKTFDEEAHDRLCREMIERLAPVGSGEHEDSLRILFVVGMPRSGSTLVDQVLATHSGVSSCGESGFFVKALRQVKGENWRSSEVLTSILSPDERKELRRLYLDQCLASDDQGKVIVDKTLENAYCSSLLLQVFPEARILYVHRNPMDMCISCFKVNFMESFSFTTDLAVLGRYYLCFDALMTQFQKTFDARFLRIDYETLVSQFEEEVRRLLDWCQLDYEPECLSFHLNERIANTASYHQVRKPLFTSAVGRWKKYGDGVAPLLEALQLDTDGNPRGEKL